MLPPPQTPYLKIHLGRLDRHRDFRHQPQRHPLVLQPAQMQFPWPPLRLPQTVPLEQPLLPVSPESVEFPSWPVQLLPLPAPLCHSHLLPPADEDYSADSTHS